MWVIVNLPGLRLYRFGFGAPLELAREPEPHLRWVLERYDERRDEQWRVPPMAGGILLTQFYYEERPNPSSPWLTPVLRAFGFYGPSVPFARHFAHECSTDADPERRVAAVLAAGSIGSPSSVDPIEARLEDADAGVRRAAVIALSQLCATRLFDRLDALARGDADLERIVALGRARRAALDAGDNLAFVRLTLGHEAFYEGLIGQAVFFVEHLREVLRHRDEREAPERRRAARVLGLCRMQAKQTMGLALEIAVDEPEPPELRAECIRLLGRLRSTPAVRKLIELLPSRDPEIQDATIDALGEIGDVRAAVPLLNQYDDRDGGVREHVELALWRLTRDLTLDEYAAWSRGELEFVPHSIYSFHHGLFPEFLEQECVSALQDPRQEVRREASLLLGVLGDPVHAPLVETVASNEENAAIRQVELQALRLLRARKG
jgi:HEAT repeat protein